MTDEQTRSTEAAPLSSNDKHKRKMEKLKASVDARIAKATIERGVVVVLTGKGKGKSSSGFGMILRALGHGQQAAVVQFIKGAEGTGERDFLQRAMPSMPFHVMETGFTWETQNKETDRAAAGKVWQHARQLLADERIDVLLLDELTYMLGYGYLDTAEVVESIRNRPSSQSVIVTGRGAGEALLNIADTVSDIHCEKHAFAAGIKARKGIEY
jgi:cob(I)alamin adenosyltransferase